MFKKFTSWLVMISYITNVMSFAYIGLLFSLIVPSQTFAATSPVAPVSLEYTCPAGMNLIAGKCKKTEKTSLTEYCEGGYYRSGDVCVRNEEEPATVQCPVGYTFNVAPFPDECSRYLGTEYSADMPGQTCEGRYPLATEIASKCYYHKPPESVNCPEDAPEATPGMMPLECSNMSVMLGSCDEEDEEEYTNGGGYITPDMRWQLDNAAYMCSRTLYLGTYKTCPTGFERNGDSCEKITITNASRSCPTGYYQKNNQCFIGVEEVCPAGSTKRYGVCVDPSGNLTCPSGQYLEESSNLCVDNRVDSQPTVYDETDFNYFYEQGAESGRLTSSSITMPTVSTNGGIDVNLDIMNADVSIEDENLLKALASGGVDANNGFTNPDGTYQDEDNQTDFIREQLDANEEFLANSANTPGSSSEEIVDNTNHTALAYGTLMDARNNNPARKISRDSAMFQNSRSSVSDAFNGTGAYFGDCTAETVTYEELDESKIVTTQQSCLKPNKNNFSGCIIERQDKIPSINVQSGDAVVHQCGDKCVQITVGLEKENHLSVIGACGVYQKTAKVKFNEGLTVDRATLTRVHYEDHFKLNAGNSNVFTGIHGTYPTGDGFPDSSINCETGGDRDIYTPSDVTTQISSAIQSDNTIEFDYKVAVGTTGEAYAKIEILFNESINSVTEEEDFVEFPAGCSEKLEEPAQTYCTASGWDCTREYTSNDENFGIVNISEGDKGDGYGLPGSHGDVLMLVVKRNYDIPNNRDTYCGIVVATTWDTQGGNDDDGVYFCENYAGVGTHSTSSRQIRGTYLTNLLPEKNEWKILAVRTDKNSATWYTIDDNDGLVTFASQKFGSGPFDNLGMTGYRIARATSARGLDWHNNSADPLYFAYWQMLESPTDAEVLDALALMKKEQAWVDFKPMYPGDTGTPICMEAQAQDYICDPLKGKQFDLAGGSFGFKDIISMNDACTPLDQDSECDAITQECLDGWYDEDTRTCYAWDVKYECQDTSNALVTKTRENNTCLTDLSCVDGSCDVKAEEQSTDFINALTAYATMNELGKARECSDPQDPSTCRVFGGEPRFCGWDQLKINDCCEEPDGLDSINVFKLGMQLHTVTSYTASAQGAFAGTGVQVGLENAGAAVEGAWNSLYSAGESAVTQAWTAVSSKLTGAVGNTAGTSSANLVSSGGSVIGNFSTSVTQALSNFKDTLMQKVYEALPGALQETIKSAATSLGGSATAIAGPNGGTVAMNTIASNVMSVVSFIGWAYAAYQLAKLAYTMLTACTDEEQDMGATLVSKKCFFTHHKSCSKTFGVCTNRAKNYYCCYESVISRIIMQQAIEQLGYSAKDFRNSMGCRGLTITELGQINFSLIDFTEWVDLMAQSDQLPIDKTMEDVTGGNISNGFGRDNALDRNLDRAPDNNWVDRRTEMEEADVGNNINCNARPRPKSCDQGVFTR